MSRFNWIEAKTTSNGRHVKVRQGEPGGRLWVDDEGTMYTISDLDFTINFAERRSMVRNKAINCRKDKIWAGEYEVYMKGAKQEDAEAFIKSLETLGYETDELMEEYKHKGKITI